MELVILYSDKKQLNHFTKSLFSLSVAQKTELFEYKFLRVIIAKPPIKIKNKNSIIILLDIKSNDKIEIEGSIVCIIDSGNKNGLKILKQQHLNAIVCGSVSDTFSLSSITDEVLTVCQQREIKNVFGKTISPQEYLIKKEKGVPIEISLLAAAAKAVISD